MVFLFLGGLLIRTSCISLLPTFLIRWDFLLPFMIYFGQRRPLFEGLLLWFIMSHWYSLESSAPIGSLVIFYLSIYVISRLLSETVFAADAIQVFTLFFIMMVFSRLTLPWVTSFFGAGWKIFSWRNLNPIWFATDFILNCSTFYFLMGVDKLTAKEARPVLDLNEGIV